jgi:hypothetical protein
MEEGWSLMDVKIQIDLKADVHDLVVAEVASDNRVMFDEVTQEMVSVFLCKKLISIVTNNEEE